MRHDRSRHLQAVADVRVTGAPLLRAAGMQRGQLRLHLTELLLSTQVVSDLLAVLKLYSGLYSSRSRTASARSPLSGDHHVCGLPSVTSSWQELLRTHGAAPGDCTARPTMPDACSFRSRSRQAASVQLVGGCCTGGTGGTGALSPVSGVDVAFKQIGSDDRIFLYAKSSPLIHKTRTRLKNESSSLKLLSNWRTGAVPASPVRIAHPPPHFLEHDVPTLRPQNSAWLAPPALVPSGSGDCQGWS